MGEVPAEGGEAAEQEEGDEDFAEERHGAGGRGGVFREMGRGSGAGMRRYAREAVGATLTCGEAAQCLKAGLADRR